MAVTLVLLFHAGLPWMTGGYIGVSVFFTLSGYLITGLLLAEHAGTRHIDLAAFYGRRLRRLLPASMLCVLAVLVASGLGAFRHVQSLRADVIGAVLQVFNWVKLSGSASYGDLFGGATSPLEHYWSLSIEEQFYWVWPLALVAVLRLRRPTAVVVALAAAFSVGAPLIAVTFGADAAYWATPARLPEILIGAALACVMSAGTNDGRRVVPKRAAAWAPVAIALIVVLACTLPSGSGPAYRGALPLLAVVSASLIWSLQVPGVVHRVLALRPLVWFGKVSYGVYLFHWPVFVLVRERGWQLTRVPDLIVALGITVGIAALSFELLEQPLRAATWRPVRTVRFAFAASAALLVATTFVGPAAPSIEADDDLLAAAGIAPSESLVSLRPTSTISVAATEGGSSRAGVTRHPSPPTTRPPISPATVPASSPRAASPPASTAAAAASAVVPTTTIVTELPLPSPPPRPARIVVAGDSTALYVAQGLATWSLAHPDHGQVSVEWCQGCTFLLEPEITSFDIEGVLDQSNITIGTNLPRAVAELQPDEVLLMVTVSDVANRQWNAAEGPLGPLDPRFRERMAQAYEALTTSLLDRGVPNVVWVIPPTPLQLWNEPEMNETARYLVQHDVIREVAAGFDQRVSVVDLDAWLTAGGHVLDDTWRRDGVHFTDESAGWLAEQYLGPLLVGVATRS